MNIKKSVLYKSLMKKYNLLKLDYRIRAHKRDIEMLKHKIEIHWSIIATLEKRNNKY